jgi:hypothetical protein
MQQDRQCTYNVILRRVCELLLPWKTNTYYIFMCVCVRARDRGRVHALCACSLAYPACNSLAPYRDVICSPSSSATFFDIIS